MGPTFCRGRLSRLQRARKRRQGAYCPYATSRSADVSGRAAGPAAAEGFSLLEVMIAVAILAASLTAIFSSQVGAAKVSQRARMMRLATSLARCKMGEIEEKVAREGLPAISAEGTDSCCDHGELEGFSCSWSLERIVLPSAATVDPTAEGAGEGTEGGDDEASAGGLVAGAGLPSDLGASALSDPSSLLGMVSTGSPSDMLAQAAIQFAFPLLKPMLEEQVRRAHVTVEWKEGTSSRTFELDQFLVSEAQGLSPTGSNLNNLEGEEIGEGPATPASDDSF